jgi:hypothetical protein
MEEEKMFNSMEAVVYAALLGVLVVWFVLPLIPAILLYKLFPDQKLTAAGVLANFKVNAAGAFAGYLVLFAAMVPFVNETYNVVGAFLHPYWTLSGQIKIIDKDGREIHHQDLFQKIRVRTQPDLYSFQDPVFIMGLPESQTVILDIPDFGTNLLQIKSNNQITRDYFHKTIELQAPLVIQETPRSVSYDATPK